MFPLSEYDDITDVYDNDVLHIVKGILGSKYKDKAVYLSKYQIRFIVVSRVHKKYNDGTIKINNFADLCNAVSDEVVNLSLSLNGHGLEVVSEAVRNRLAVNDMDRSKTGDKVDLEDS